MNHVRYVLSGWTGNPITFKPATFYLEVVRTPSATRPELTLVGGLFSRAGFLVIRLGLAAAIAVSRCMGLAGCDVVQRCARASKVPALPAGPESRGRALRNPRPVDPSLMTCLGDSPCASPKQSLFGAWLFHNLHSFPAFGSVVILPFLAQKRTSMHSSKQDSSL